jgi:3-oxoacyl-[acyl-carrier protein] reductase
MNTQNDTQNGKQQQKVAIVTGASRGIGAAIAERLAREGYTVVVNYAGSEAAAEALVRKIEAAGGRAIAARADVADAQAVARLFDAAEAAFGGVDVLVNNAGIMSLASVATSSDELFDKQIAINLKGSFNTLREAAKRLRNGGRIVNFSTSVVGLKLENYGVYAATKAAVETLTAILSKELRGRDRPLPRRQVAGAGRAPGQDESAGASRHAGRHRRGGRLPRRCRRRLDQWPGTARQRRHGLNLI